MTRRVVLPIVSTALALAAYWLIGGAPRSAVSGVVLDAAGRPVPSALVRLKGRSFSTTTDSAGVFMLSGFPAASRVRLTAWRDGSYIAGTTVWPWTTRATIRLSPIAMRDHAGYQWMPPSIAGRSRVSERLVRMSLSVADLIAPEAGALRVGAALTVGCQDCHESIVAQWASSAHALGAANPRFLTMYNGTDARGAVSPPTRYVVNGEYGRVPLRPDPASPDFGPGFKLDFPHSDGDCASCHVPSAVVDRRSGVDPNHVGGIEARGVHCDFCHKTADVTLDARTGVPFDNMPGVLSMRVVRPAPGSQVFFGPFDDADGGRDTRAPVMQRSEMCAPCHYGTFWGVPIYESYAEWKGSGYAAAGTTCQSCHMAPDGRTNNIAPRRGGVPRDPGSLATHAFPGASAAALLKSAASLSVAPTRVGDRLHVAVTVTNTGAGHRLPTDSPLRAVLLVVEASRAGVPAKLVQGPVLPEWAGDLAGRPGAYFAKLLEQRWTNVMPSAAYWTATRIAEDTRLQPRENVVHGFDFVARRGEDVSLAVRLMYRRAPYALMQQKAWRVPDIEMNRVVIVVAADSDARTND